MKNYSFSDLNFSPRSHGGVAARITFDNGYTASVVRGDHTYGGSEGLYELAVIYNGEIVYDTPVTNDVVGWLTEGDVTEKLNEVACLPRRGTTAILS
jgi:hypothetical protein